MTIRYEPIAGIKQIPQGRFITFAEHEALVRELLESLAEYFKQVERGALAAVDAELVVKCFVKMRGLDI
jgi:hypothetical protein